MRLSWYSSVPVASLALLYISPALVEWVLHNPQYASREQLAYHRQACVITCREQRIF